MYQITQIIPALRESEFFQWAANYSGQFTSRNQLHVAFIKQHSTAKVSGINLKKENKGQTISDIFSFPMIETAFKHQVISGFTLGFSKRLMNLCYSSTGST